MPHTQSTPRPEPPASRTVTVPGEIAAAVQWWCDVLVGDPAHDNGEPMHNMMASMLSATLTPLPETRIASFGGALTRRLMERMERGDRDLTLGVDYGPCAVLADSAAEVGITRMDRFPWKTHMYIQDGKCEVSRGYGAPSVTIYPLAEGSTS